LGLDILRPPDRSSSITKKSEIAQLLKRAREGDESAVLLLAKEGIKFIRPSKG